MPAAVADSRIASGSWLAARTSVIALLSGAYGPNVTAGVTFTPGVSVRPSGSAPMPDPNSATRSTSFANAAMISRSIASSASGGASSWNSALRTTFVRSVWARRCIAENVRALSPIGAISAFHSGVAPVATRAQTALSVSIGITVAPASTTAVRARTRSMMPPTICSPIRMPPPASVPSTTAWRSNSDRRLRSPTTIARTSRPRLNSPGSSTRPVPRAALQAAYESCLPSSIPLDARCWRRASG